MNNQVLREAIYLALQDYPCINSMNAINPRELDYSQGFYSPHMSNILLLWQYLLFLHLYNKAQPIEYSNNHSQEGE